MSRWRIGGLADVVVEPSSLDQLVALRRLIAEEELPSVVIGDTSNLLFVDQGLRAICIRIGSRLSKLSITEDTVTAEAGIWIPTLARKIMQAGLSGAEHTCGIPGSLGGLICMNGGSQRKGIGSAVVSVTAVDTNGKLLTFDGRSCEFGYRQSIFQHNDAIIASSILRFDPERNRNNIRRKMLAILKERSSKFPRKQFNCGSVFKSNPEMYAEIGAPGSVIERLGFKGYKIGGAEVSKQHANFFVNTGSSCAEDMICLIREVGDAVLSATGYKMESEVKVVNPDGSILPVY